MGVVDKAIQTRRQTINDGRIRSGCSCCLVGNVPSHQVNFFLISLKQGFTLDAESFSKLRWGNVGVDEPL